MKLLKYGGFWQNCGSSTHTHKPEEDLNFNPPGGQPILVVA